MDSIPTTGRQAWMMNSLGKQLAEMTRGGSAPNQQVADALPLEMTSKPKLSRGQDARSNVQRTEDGRPRMQ